MTHMQTSNGVSQLFVTATPLGNLKDVTLRALDVLKEVDLILCEDTRVTKKLLERYNIKTPLLSYHQHSKIPKLDHILELLKSGKNLALVSDSGTPGVSDPGAKLIEFVQVRLPETKIVPVPGASALAAVASISGFPMDRFLFLGFPPAKKKRKKFFEEVVSSKYPVIFYESPHRIIKTLKELQLLTKNYQLKTKLVVCRELTKKFETIYRGTVEQVLYKLEKSQIKGEFVVVVDKK
ncbi:MAG: putative S-adenosylmethionine-dependent methyltransferase, YraL family [Parcubacteria group bacterium Gr01-1014_30]|nr:MAG: putative S-adenosylmethionine-dependent methyltransferase, YraL family [Parcubacteria group bacterium Gr01-1014_30]